MERMIIYNLAAGQELIIPARKSYITGIYSDQTISIYWAQDNIDNTGIIAANVVRWEPTIAFQPAVSSWVHIVNEAAVPAQVVVRAGV